MKRRRSLYVHLSHIKLLAKKFMLVFLFFTAFVLMLLNKTDNVILDNTSSVASDVISSLVDVLVIPAKVLAQGYDWIKNFRSVYADNELLKAENRRLNVIYDRYKSLEIENKLLASLLNYVVPPKAEFITARVVAEEGDAFAHSMTAFVGEVNVKKGQVAL